MSDDANKKFYFNPLDKREMKKAFLELAEQSKVLQLWQKEVGDQERGPLEDYQIHSYDYQKQTFFLRPTDPKLIDWHKSRYDGQDVLFKVEMDELQYFSKGTLRFDKPRKRYTLEVNDKVFRSQQRSSIRIKASDKIRIRYVIEKDVYEGNDISAGGISFKIPLAETNRFVQGSQHFNGVLHFNKAKFTIPKIVIATTWTAQSEMMDDGSTQTEHMVGAKFENLPATVEKALSILIDAVAGEEMLF